MGYKLFYKENLSPQNFFWILSSSDFIFATVVGRVKEIAIFPCFRRMKELTYHPSTFIEQFQCALLYGEGNSPLETIPHHPKTARIHCTLQSAPCTEKVKCNWHVCNSTLLAEVFLLVQIICGHFYPVIFAFVLLK